MYLKFNILSLSGGFVSLKILEVARVYRFDVSMTKKSNFFFAAIFMFDVWNFGILIFIIQPNTTSNIGRCSMCRISTVIHCPWNFKTSTHVTKWFIIYKVYLISCYTKWEQNELKSLQCLLTSIKTFFPWKMKFNSTLFVE